MNRRLRSFSSVIALVSLLAAQLALPFHGCRIEQRETMADYAMDVSAGSAQSVALCEQHCRHGVSFSGIELAPRAAVLAIPIAWLRIVVPDGDSLAASTVLQRPPLPSQPPPAIRFAVLRI